MASPTSERITLVDPRSLYFHPPFPQQAQSLPGTTSHMKPVPDHGEQSYEGTGQLRGLNALITGGDSGIGRAVAICFAREGANVAISYLNESSDATETCEFVQRAGVSAAAWPGDIREEAHCRELIRNTVDQFGGLDVLVNNAGYQETRDAVKEFSSEVLDRIMKTNLYATFWLSQAALEYLPPGGSIINTASIQGYSPSAFLLPYSATKSALLGMTKGLAKVAIERGVRVNAVAPGPVWTPLIPSSMPPEHVENFGSNTLFGRPAQPIELAPLYVWLASPTASYVTGEVFGCTGGKTPV